MKLKKNILIAFSLLLFGAAANAQNAKNDYQIGKSMEILLNLFKEANLYYVDSVNSEKMLNDAARAMLEGLDPYTVYLPSAEMEDFETMTTGKYGGVGALIRQNGQWVEISEPYQGTPSDRAGLKAGDRILFIDDTDLKGATTQRVSALLRGEPGTTFKLKIRPIRDTTTILEVKIRREQITQPSVPYFGFVADGIGFLRLDSFTEECSVEVRSAVEAMKKSGELKGLIIDLRGNGGGIVGEAVKIASLFLPKGTAVVSLKGKIKEFNSTYVTKTAPIEPTLPLVILSSSVSASASEILAGALQDLDRAVIIGQRSFGKGLVQTTKPVGYDSYLKVTTAKYYTPSGRCIQALDYTHRKDDGSVGVIPDSLMQQFTTVGGRKVFSGGGIQPDIKTDHDYYSKFTAILIAYGLIDDFANEYAAHNQAQDLSTFVVDDALYERFVEQMQDKKIQYQSATSIKLNELRTWAAREKYDDRLSEEFAAIERKIKEDKMAELRSFAPEIRQVLAESIINRWYYLAGSIEYSLKSDKDVQQAASILESHEQYTKIVTTQDTLKN